MWVVGIKRPFYPSVWFFADEEEAKNQYEELQMEHEDDGEYDGVVFIAKVEELTNIKTSY